MPHWLVSSTRPVSSPVSYTHLIADSEEQGISIIYQELALVPELSIYENIFFGHEIMSGHHIDWNETIVRAKEVLKKVPVSYTHLDVYKRQEQYDAE